ncbi:ATP-binding protein [Candidatus Omnitrophota bacterium]
MKYLLRQIEQATKKYLSIFPVVAITGPRQSGKSTMLKKAFGEKYNYLTFDDPIIVERFVADPKGFIEEYSDKIIFDEVQRVPELFHYLKMEVDNDRENYGKFILTGSSQFEFLKNITETLAGRIGMLTLLPFQSQEIPKKLQGRQILSGSYPELINRNYKGAREWYASYLRNYLERDVRSLANIGNMRDFQRLISLLAARTSQPLNLSTLAKEIGISVKTVQSWISVLQASYIIFLLPSYHHNLGKRIIKRPKLYFYDTGLVSYLTGIRDIEMLEKGPLQGEIFETYIVSEITKAVFHNDKDVLLYYFRDNLGLEVDLIIEDKTHKRVDFIEIKNSHTLRPPMAKPLKSLIGRKRSQVQQIHGSILYKGKSSGKIYENINYLNFKQFLENFVSR